MTHRSNLIKILIAGLLTLLVLTACSRAEEPPAAPAAAEVAAPEAPAEVPAPAKVEVAATAMPEAAEPPALTDLAAEGVDERRGGYITVGSSAGFTHLDIHQEDQESLAVMGPGLAYSRLLRISSGEEGIMPSLALECDLCRSWELQPDMAYEFKLRPDVTWHQIAPVSGRPLVAEDLAYSYGRMRQPGWPGADRFANRGIGEIIAVDDHTLRVELEFVDSDALLALADGHSKIVAQEVVERFGDLKRAPIIGTGPWVWERTHRQVGMDFSRNPDYFLKGQPYMDGISVKSVSVPNDSYLSQPDRVALLQGGQIDATVVPPTDWERLRETSGEFNARLSQRPEIGVVMYLNTREYPLNQLPLRQAIFKAMDPWEYVDIDWAGQGNVGLGMPSIGPDWQLSRDEIHDDYLASPSEARDILEQAGIHSPLPVELAVPNLGPHYLALGRQAAEDLEKVGFAPRLRPVSPNYWKRHLAGQERDFQISLGPVPPHPTTNGYLYALLHSQGPRNIIGHADPKLDQLIEQQARELNPAQRREQLLDLQRHVLKQGYMFSPVTGSYRWVFNWDVKDFYPNMALSEYHYWADVWLER